MIAGIILRVSEHVQVLTKVINAFHIPYCASDPTSCHTLLYIAVVCGVSLMERGSDDVMDALPTCAQLCSNAHVQGMSLYTIVQGTFYRRITM